LTGILSDSYQQVNINGGVQVISFSSLEMLQDLRIADQQKIKSKEAR